MAAATSAEIDKSPLWCYTGQFLCETETICSPFTYTIAFHPIRSGAAEVKRAHSFLICAARSTLLGVGHIAKMMSYLVNRCPAELSGQTWGGVDFDRSHSGWLSNELRHFHCGVQI